MDNFLIYLAFSFGCFLVAIAFFRKDNTPMYRILLPFMTSMYSPYKMKEHLKTEGIYLVILGYLSIFVYLVFFF